MHDAEMGWLVLNPNMPHFAPQKLDVEVDVERGNDAALKGIDQFPRYLAETWSVHDIRVGDTVDVRCVYRTGD
jgi:hypothetical protein